MAYLIFIVISFALLAAFHALLWHEKRRGVRVLSDTRARLDTQVERIEFIIEHVDLSAFIREEASRIAAKVGHDAARVSLLAVRVVERLLTRLVRYLRTRHLSEEHETRAPRETTREFVRTLSNFKNQLEATRPEMPPLQ